MFSNYYQVRDWLEGFIPLVYGKEELGLARIENLLKLLGNPERKFKSIHVAGTSGKGSVAYYAAKLLSEHSENSDKSESQTIRKSDNQKVRQSGKSDSLNIRYSEFSEYSGSKIGLHISPHLVDIRERMQVFRSGKWTLRRSSGQEVESGKSARGLIPMGRFLRLFNELKPVVAKIQKEKPELAPSYFEILVAATFKYFAEEKVDWAVVEVGLGGRLDATNVLVPQVSVITNIGLDHTEILGNTIEEIAAEKAGIIKEKVSPSFAKASDGKKVSKVTKVSKVSMVKKVGVPVVTGATGSALKVIEKVAREKGAPLFLITNYKLPITKKPKITSNVNFELAKKAVEVALSGQKTNIKPVILSPKDEESQHRLFTSFGMMKGLGSLPGRFEEIEQGVILDGAHNPDKVQALIHFVNSKVQIPNYKKGQEEQESNLRVSVSESRSRNSSRQARTIMRVVLVLAFKKGKDWKTMVDLLVNQLQIPNYKLQKIIATQYQAVTDTGKGSAIDPEEVRQYIDSRFKIQDLRIINNSQEAVFEALQSTVNYQLSTVIVTGSLYLVGEVRNLWYLPEI